MAAFLTVTQMEKPIQSFQDLSLQTDMLYGTVEKTSIHDYLKLKSDEDESSQKGSQYRYISKLMLHSLRTQYLIILSKCQTRLCSWPHEYGGRKNTVNVKGFEVQNVREPNLKWSRLWKVVNSTRIKTAEEGFNKVHEQGQKFAFLWDVAIIEYKILTDQDCSLTTVKVSGMTDHMTWFI